MRFKELPEVLEYREIRWSPSRTTYYTIVGEEFVHLTPIPGSQDEKIGESRRGKSNVNRADVSIEDEDESTKIKMSQDSKKCPVDNDEDYEADDEDVTDDDEDKDEWMVTSQKCEKFLVEAAPEEDVSKYTRMQKSQPQSADRCQSESAVTNNNRFINLENHINNPADNPDPPCLESTEKIIVDEEKSGFKSGTLRPELNKIQVSESVSTVENNKNFNEDNEWTDIDSDSSENVPTKRAKISRRQPKSSSANKRWNKGEVDNSQPKTLKTVTGTKRMRSGRGYKEVLIVNPPIRLHARSIAGPSHPSTPITAQIFRPSLATNVENPLCSEIIRPPPHKCAERVATFVVYEYEEKVITEELVPEHVVEVVTTDTNQNFTNRAETMDEALPKANDGTDLKSKILKSDDMLKDSTYIPGKWTNGYDSTSRDERRFNKISESSKMSSDHVGQDIILKLSIERDSHNSQENKSRNIEEKWKVNKLPRKVQKVENLSQRNQKVTLKLSASFRPPPEPPPGERGEERKRS